MLFCTLGRQFGGYFDQSLNFVQFLKFLAFQIATLD